MNRTRPSTLEQLLAAQLEGELRRRIEQRFGFLTRGEMFPYPMGIIELAGLLNLLPAGAALLMERSWSLRDALWIAQAVEISVTLRCAG